LLSHGAVRQSCCFGALQLAGTPLKVAVVNPGERVAIAIQFEIGAS
jgi:hypothetical protein